MHSKTLKFKNTSEEDIKSEAHQFNDNGDENNDANRTCSVEEWQRLVACHSNRLRREPDHLRIPLPSEVVH